MKMEFEFWVNGIDVFKVEFVQVRVDVMRLMEGKMEFIF